MAESELDLRYAFHKWLNGVATAFLQDASPLKQARPTRETEADDRGFGDCRVIVGTRRAALPVLFFSRGANTRTRTPASLAT